MAGHRMHDIHIEGFRSIRSCDVQLNDINILIGANGAGKSNFIDALSLLQKISKKELQVTVAESGLPAILYRGRKVTDKICMEFSFDENSYGFELVPTDDNRLTFRAEYFGYRNERKPIQTPMGHFESLYELGTGDEPHCIEPVLDAQEWRVYHFQDTGRASRMKQEHNISDNDNLHQDASNLAAFLFMLRNNHPPEYGMIRDTVKLTAPYFEDFVLRPQQSNNELIVLRWKQIGCDDVFNASQLSDGTLRFICLTTLLLMPRKFKPSTVIIDEPELGLHPYAVTLLSEMVRSASVDSQIIISTQSADLIAEFEPKDIIVTEMDGSGTTFNRLNDESLNEWLEDYTLGDLWKKNLFGGRP